MDRFLKIAITVLFVGFLAACQQTIKSDVMRFHQLPQPNGEKIMIVPMNPNNTGSLEFANYATLVGNELGRYGYVPADGAEPDLIVELDYGVDEGQQVVRHTGSMMGAMYFGGYYGRFYHPWYMYRYPFYRPMYYGGFYDPFGYYPLGMQSRTRTYVNYNRHLKMVIKPNRNGAQNLYEGEVKSKGRNNNLHEVMPYMVQAFFTNFPGVSGSSERVSVEIPENS
ncbi:DUF4136 domain-containing protein [Pseudemcibacter aquimaris]|uniref:DUF4136 domain-containing protein n=1 Tax=Pseudemcibacter aquimaris TaxID=2857064 RepID=UPI002013A258|nr:DUF4136 domain-containing protein [Pseudemcibacter aquimaris]MCC3862360.1 DUF4136 domain-containing protein [Pseudemcibacter aquimaris]WDU59209.1 DUF4136 domain-containing protein [Pseudemcibacter aquimaris]